MDPLHLRPTHHSCPWGPWPIFGITILGMALLGAGLIWTGTPYGLGLREDSYYYLAAAESLRAGAGYARTTGAGSFSPITNYPPLYSATIAWISSSGLETTAAARYVNAGLFGLTIGMIGMAVASQTTSPWWGAAAAALVLSSEVLIELHSWAQSEPLFISLTLIFLITLSAGRKRGGAGVMLLAAAGIAAGLAALTRYVGVVLIVAGVAFIGLTWPSPRSARLWRALTFSALALPPIAAFLVRNALVSDSLLNRPPPTWHPPDSESWAQAASAVLRWWIPDRLVQRLSGIQAELALGSAVLAVAIALWLGSRRRDPPFDIRSRDLAHLLVITLSVYLLAVLATVLFLDRLTPLDNRILSPAYLVVNTLGILLLHSIFKSGVLAWRAAAAVAVLLLLVLQVRRAVALHTQLEVDGRGFASRQWRESEVLSHVRTLERIPIYSNNVPAIYLVAHRTASFIPTPLNPATMEPRADYRADLERMLQTIQRRRGLLVIVGRFPETLLEPGHLGDLTRGLQLKAHFDDGLVYGAVGG